jgi:Tol biopolymer transport system component
MTAFDRFERQLPELMDELASPQLPDYFDNMLTRTARTRQRPAWASLERWLPMGVIARPSLVPPLPWRSIGIFVILALLAVAGALIYVSSRQRLPEPFGPARNGSILVSTVDGEIVSVDPATGASSGLVTGPANDIVPALSRDGTKFLFVRAGSGSADALYVANVDGSDSRQLAQGSFVRVATDLSPFDWSPSGDRVAFISQVGSARKLTILALDGSAPRTLDLGLSVSDVSWRPNGQELVFRGVISESSGTTYGLYTVSSDGSGLRPIVPVTDLEFGWREPVLSPDGTHVAFARWGSATGNGLHVVGVESGDDRVVEFDGHLDSDQYNPQFSPDGTQLVFARFENGEYQLSIAPVNGGGQAIAIGPRHSQETADPFLGFSPDGTMVLARYPADGKTWLLGSKGGDDQQVSWPAGRSYSWQRLAP